MNEKSGITRDNFRSSLMKELIIRLDYTPMTDITGFILALKKEEWLRDFFESYNKVQKNNVNINLSPSAFDAKNVPIEVNSQEDIHRFYNCKIGSQNSGILDICSTYMYINVICNENYNTIDDFVKCIVRIFNFLQEYDSFTNIERIAIRKTDGNNFKTEKEAFETFEEEGFQNPANNGIANITRRVSQLSYYDTNSNTKLNVSKAVILNEDKTVRFILDTDVYIDKDCLKNIKNISNNLESTLMGTINNVLFEVFKQNVTLQFLKSGIK